MEEPEEERWRGGRGADREHAGEENREEAEEVHNECIRAQDQIQREIKVEEQTRRKRKAKQDAHTHVPPPVHLVHDTTNDNGMPVVSSEHHRELDIRMEPDQNDTIRQLMHKLRVPREAYES